MEDAIFSRQGKVDVSVSAVFRIGRVNTRIPGQNWKLMPLPGYPGWVLQPAGAPLYSFAEQYKVLPGLVIFDKFVQIGKKLRQKKLNTFL